MRNQTLIRGAKFQVYKDDKGQSYRVCWLHDGRQYVVRPMLNLYSKGYVATFTNGYTGETLERIAWFKTQYSAIYACQAHAEKGGPEKFTRTGPQSWVRTPREAVFSGSPELIS
jgi:hypothetical protein